MKTCTPGQAIVDGLVAEGVDTIFGLPGGHILGVYDALYRTPEVRHILVRHEHAAAAMAAGYYQLTGKPGVCLVTAGPGATNLLTAVTEAYIGSVPLVILAARAVTSNAHRGAQQEIPTEKIFDPVTKWAVRADRSDHLPELLFQAFRIATSGRPGPVYIDIPKDLLDGEITVLEYALPATSRRQAGDRQQISAVARELLEAQRPIIIAGGGAVASGAFEELRLVAERLAAPVLTTLSGRGAFPDDHPLAAGGLGFHRNDLSARLLVEADYVLALGTRFEEMDITWRPGFVPSPGVPVAQVDLDGSVFGRSVQTTSGIVGDVLTVLDQLLDVLGREGAKNPESVAAHPRALDIARGVAEIDRQVAAVRSAPGEALNPLEIVSRAREVFPRETTVAVDVGCLAQGIGGAFPYFRVYEPRSVISPSSFYGMGFCAAAAPVARVVYPDRAALCFVGDGSFQMVMNVLPVAAESKLGVTWCILNDGALGSIRDLQEYRLGRRFLATDFEINPDFARVAQACECYGETVTEAGEIDGALARALEANGRGVPAVLDFRVFPLRLTPAREYFNLYHPGEVVS